MNEYGTGQAIKKGMEALGFTARTSGSNQSNSAYVEFWYEPADDEYDDLGNCLIDDDLLVDRKIRISDHDIPSSRDCGDYEVNTGSQLRHESHSDDWCDAIKWAGEIMRSIRK